MPWVRIPVGPCLRGRREPCALYGALRYDDSRRKTDAPSRESGDGKGRARFRGAHGTCDDDRMYVQSRRPLDPFIGSQCTISQLATVPAGGWLGSKADDGRAKLR